MTMQNEIYVNDRQLGERFGVHPKTIWFWARQGRFPQPVKLGPNCTRWRSSDVEAWEKSRHKVERKA